MGSCGLRVLISTHSNSPPRTGSRQPRSLATPPPCRADHSRKNSRSLMKTNHQWTRMNTQIDQKTDGPASTTSGTKILLRFCALGVTMSWDDGFLGARASRPHQAWHSLAHLPHLDQPGTAPWLSFGLADAVPADRVAACSIALKLSGGHRDRMRAGRPRSQAMPPQWFGRGCLAVDFSESRPTPFGKLPFARESSPHPARRGGSYGVEQGCFRTSD